MSFIFRNGPNQRGQLAAVSNLIPTPITNISVTSTVAGQLNLTWTGGVGNNVKNTYSVYNNTGSVLVSPTAYAISGTNPTTITFTDTTFKSYTVTVTANVLDGNTNRVSNAVAIGVPFTINSATNFQSTDISGTTIMNGSSYVVYAFKSTGISYSLNYSCAGASTVYVLAVGGGGGGGEAGGGAGGVAMLPVSVPASTNQIISISVADGGTGDGNDGYQGGSTSVTFNGTGVNATTPLSVTGGGGGGGSQNNGTPPRINGVNGGSGGGNSASQPFGTTTNANSNFANPGGSDIGWYSGAGGGGAGQSGFYGLSTNVAGNGGNGIRCLIPGIATFSPSGTPYGNYYWGGGGGGGYGTCGSGGKGGGASAGPGNDTSLTIPAGDTNGITPAGTGIVNVAGGSGGSNTGGGGGGNNTQRAGGKGGSGIVVLAFLQNPKTIPTISNNTFLSPDITVNTTSTILSTATTSTTVTNWTCTASSSNTSMYLIDSSTNTFGLRSTAAGTQYILTDFAPSAVTNCTATISQNITINPGKYTLVYYAIYRPGIAISTLNASISGSGYSTVSGNASFTNELANQWVAQYLNFTISTANTYNLTFTATNGTTGTETAVGMAYASIY